jgi:hypothetical protein
MLFMTVFTYGPSQRDEVIRRRVEKGALVPKGIKMLGEWSYAGDGRVFRLFESDDPTAMADSAMSWTDLGKLEVYPVVEVDKILAHVAETMAAATATH